MHKGGGKEKPLAVAEAMNPFELTSMNVCKIKIQRLKVDLWAPDF